MASKSAYIAFIQYIGDNGWVSRDSLKLLGYSRTSLWKYLSKMIEEGVVLATGKKRTQTYRLSPKGYEILANYNPERNGENQKLLELVGKSYGEKKERWVERTYVEIMSDLAGYSIHKYDKPNLDTVSQILTNGSERPAHIALLFVDLSPLPDESKNSIYDYAHYQYYTEEDCLEYDRNLDTTIYTARDTPVGCYYSRREIMELADEEEKTLGMEGRQSEIHDNLKYGIFSGILFTGNGSYRIYTTKNTAPKIQVRGEINTEMFLTTLSNKTYKRSLETLYNPTGRGTMRGNILFGDTSYRAVDSILENSDHLSYEKRKRLRRGAVNFNLLDLPETFYIPKCREAIPVYSMMIYHDFEIMFRLTAKEYYKLNGITVTPYRNPITSGRDMLWDNVTPEGKLIACIIPMKIDRVQEILNRVDFSMKQNVIIVCMDYEMDFYKRLLECYTPQLAKKIEIQPIPTPFMRDWLAGVRAKEAGVYTVFPIVDTSWDVYKNE